MWLKTKVLLWKSSQLRKRQWMCSIIELLLPCLLFFCMDYQRSKLNTYKPDVKFTNETIPDPIPEKDLYEYFKINYSDYFIYTPKTSETIKIISLVAQKLNINHIDTAKNEKEMIQKIEQKFNDRKEMFLNSNVFGVIFEETVKSHIFKYKIRTTNNFWRLNQRLFPKFEISGPMNSSHLYMKSGFIALQLALDNAFITLSNIVNTSININDYNLKIQSYPYTKYLYSSNSIIERTFLELFPLLTVLSFLLMCSYTIKRIVEEKNSGIKEFMKMMGLKSWMIWTGWIIHNCFIYVISITVIIYITCIKINTDEKPMLNYTNPLLFWSFLLLYMITGIFFCFAISSFFKSPLFALITGILMWCFSYILPLTFLKSITNINIQILLMLLPNFALSKASEAIFLLESQKKGLQFSTLFTAGNEDIDFSVGFVSFMFFIDCFLYGCIAWFMDSVMPGKYGVAKPINFLCKWSKNKTINYKKRTINENNSTFFEKPPTEYKVEISVQNLHKRFGNLYAVNGVNLDLYKGQITALLGHNGAGKTTTMSIITGLFSPTSGSVIINGKDIFSNIDDFRNNLGLCPQHNLLFSNLTTLEHLIFFGMLKGMPLQIANLEGLRLLKLLNVLKKKNELVNNLSGGMKRKICLAIALIGNPEILILDEPTSGMDPESRREMWDLLLSFRGSKTILITTHFMEEADVLGDRIAIMDHGQVKCYGTLLFLKKAYGTGYNLKIVKEKLCNNESNIIELIREIIPEAKIQNLLTDHVIINLPNEHTDKFPDIFKMLETKKERYCIKAMGISYTTMDEVFMSSSTTLDNRDELNQLSNNDVTQITMSEYTSGLNLLKNQFKILLQKNIIFTYRKWLMTLVFIIGPIILSIFVMKLTYYIIRNSAIPKKINISLSTYKDSNVYYRAGDKSFKNLEPTFVALSKKSQASVIETSSKNNTINDLLKMCEHDEFKYRTHLMIAGDFNETNSTVIYNNIAIHASAIAINLYSNALFQKLSGNTEAYISTVNEPIKPLSEDVCNNVFIMSIVLLWLITFTPGLLFLIGYFIGLPLNERISGIKHLQMMSKLSPTVYWAANFIWNYLCYIFTIILTLVAVFIFDEYQIFTHFKELSVLLTLLLVYGWSSIFYAYVYSFFNKTHLSSMLLFIAINFLIGMFINSFMLTMKVLVKTDENEKSSYKFWNICWYIILIIPHFSYSACLARFIEIAWENYRHRICNSFDETSSTKNYFVFKSHENKSGILEETLFLFFSSILYISIILLYDYKIFARIYQFGCDVIYGTGISFREDNEDPDIIKEKDKVNAAKTHSYDTFSPLLLVHDLVKKFSFKSTSVRGISFTVSPGECFGLLGVNGAGKSTTFQMLTGCLLPSNGDAFIKTDKLYELSSNTNQYISKIGYCPQFDALNDQLTGEESLKLMAILRGISPLSAKQHVDKWIRLLGLNEYKNRVCGYYSGGNKRKLNTAMALIGDPPVVFLDEPTSGVDPVARRNIWQLLAASQKGGQAVVLTSHSMDECEALCNRLTIMVSGVMKCIGDIQYLKKRYAQGFTIMIKLGYEEEVNVMTLKAVIESQFTPSIHLKDEHIGLLHYHIFNPNIPLSEIFNQMESIKDSYSIIEDYTVSDTTLEQVFKAFAKGQAVLNSTT